MEGNESHLLSCPTRGVHADYAGPARSFDSGRGHPIGQFSSTQASQESSWAPYSVTHLGAFLMSIGLSQRHRKRSPNKTYRDGQGKVRRSL